MALRAATDDEQQFTMHAVVDTHRRFMDLSAVYTNDPVWVDHSIHIMELLLAAEKYKLLGFDLEYTRTRAWSRPKVAIAQLCVRHHVLVYHYCLATRPCERFAKFVNVGSWVPAKPSRFEHWGAHEDLPLPIHVPASPYRYEV